MIFRVLSNGRELLIDNKRKVMKYYGKARDFQTPAVLPPLDAAVLAGSGPVPEENKRDVLSVGRAAGSEAEFVSRIFTPKSDRCESDTNRFLFIEWDEFLRRME